MGAGRKTHLFHRLFEVAGGFRVELAMLADLARSHRGVGGMAAAAEALMLDLPRGNHPRTDDRGRLADVGVRREFAEIHQRHLHMEVNSI